jgi:hypothetical protein
MPMLVLRSFSEKGSPGREGQMINSTRGHGSCGGDFLFLFSTLEILSDFLSLSLSLSLHTIGIDNYNWGFMLDKLQLAKG